MIDEGIRDPDATDRHELVDVLAQAFRDNPMNLAIHGSHPRRRLRANRAGLRALVLDTRATAVSRVIRHQGRVVGGFVLVPPGGTPLPGPALHRQIGCLFHQGVRAMEQWTFVTSSLMQNHPTGEYWYLAVLGVVPRLHGHGFGSRLVQALIRLVEDDPNPLYLESDREASMRFYLARGFAPLSELTLLDVRCWCLGLGFPGVDENLCDSVREL